MHSFEAGSLTKLKVTVLVMLPGTEASRIYLFPPHLNTGVIGIHTF